MNALVPVHLDGAVFHLYDVVDDRYLCGAGLDGSGIVAMLANDDDIATKRPCKLCLRFRRSVLLREAATRQRQRITA